MQIHSGMRAPLETLLLLSLLAGSSGIALAQVTAVSTNPGIAANDVTWTTLGKDENDSMPIGNGDLAANVWTEQNGDVLLLVAKSDAYTERGQLVKLGRIRLHIDPNPLADGHPFTQVLRLEDASIVLQSGKSMVRIWADANHPALHIETHLERPGTFRATVEDWRLDQGDSFASTDNDRITWYHYNTKSSYPDVLKEEHLTGAITGYEDPLLHRCFGATLLGSNLAASGDAHSLESIAAGKDFRVDVVALTEHPAVSPASWQSSLDSLLHDTAPSDLQPLWTAHRHWWQQFWDRSWINVSGKDDAQKVSQGYAMQRYMMGSSSRGELPVKFNGGLFTVGRDLEKGVNSTDQSHDPDYRAWGESYWNQNNRLLYWPLVTSGDYDLLQPWFRMYINALPVATARATTYYNHAGALYPETMYFWGLPRLPDFGRNNPTNDIQSRWQRYHIQGSLEVALEMLDYFDATGDTAFVRSSLVPFADAIVTFYGVHYPRDAKGKILMSPAQSLETYQLTAVNPTPDNAGLRAVIARLLTLPTALTTGQQRTTWANVVRDLPPIPLGQTTAQGKTPPLGVGDSRGATVILPAEKYDKTANSENPELYVVFPYRLFGVGKPNLELARATFAARRFPANTCWGQDGNQAAVLGLTSEAQKDALSYFTNYGDERFPWFWNKSHDWIPDMDNGGDGMITLQLMLMQTDGRRIHLLPAWPANWTADFKLHAPLATTVEGHVEVGKVTRLVVTPPARAKDVIVVKAQ
jgi:alpha-L-fucosidase 2